VDWSVFGTGNTPDRSDRQTRLAEIFAAGLRMDLHWRQLYVRVYGDIAIASGYIGGWVRFPDGDRIQGQWRFHRVWIRRDRAWHMAPEGDLPAEAAGLLADMASQEE
jgi:hypothetical protein